jgi:hypothetical protein
VLESGEVQTDGMERGRKIEMEVGREFYCWVARGVTLGEMSKHDQREAGRQDTRGDGSDRKGKRLR